MYIEFVCILASSYENKDNILAIYFSSNHNYLCFNNLIRSQICRIGGSPGLESQWSFLQIGPGLKSGDIKQANNLTMHDKIEPIDSKKHKQNRNTNNNI
jgi:hypothetical protein